MSPKKRVYIFINGILTSPLDHHAWTDRAVLWVETGTPYKAVAYEYFCDAIFRRFGQERRVRDVVDIVNGYDAKGFDVVLVGHSNGADIICRLLNEYDCTIYEAHLVAGACERDCNKNGINSAIYDGRLSASVYLYCSIADRALKLARNTSPLLRLVGLGYGDMGLEGPVNQCDPTRIIPVWNNTFDHCDYWKPENFDNTMRLLTHRA